MDGFLNVVVDLSYIVTEENGKRVAERIIDFLFGLCRKNKNKTNLIIGGCVIFCKYIGSCLTENIIGTNIFIPINLIYNAGHYFGFLIGIILSLVINLTSLQINKQIE